MKTFTQYLEATEDDIQATKAEENPVFKFKENLADLVNGLLESLEEEEESGKIVHKINRFAISLEKFNEDATNIIENKRTQLEYLKQYEALTSLLDIFKNPPTNIDPSIKKLKEQLNLFHEFVQAKISL